MKQYEIFCTVIDNYGDAAVSWRLARQLANEHGLSVRLWIDDLTPLAALEPDVAHNLSAQNVAGVDIHHWREPIDPYPLGEVDTVIAAFGCRLPEPWLNAMAASQRPPRWLNLEYLSAETWVETCHLLPSPHPRLPLTQRFFFPGFTTQTGGLLREQHLIQERDQFQSDPAAQAEFWRRLGVNAPADAIKISLFAYAHAPLSDILHAWAQATQLVCCLIPQSPLTAIANTLPAWLQQKLSIHHLPFLSQHDYDRLLWACDANFIRGEDSLVRALWAARPLVWHIYPQEMDAHTTKLNAFLDRQLQYTDAETVRIAKTFAKAWNAMTPTPEQHIAALDWLHHLPTLSHVQQRWSQMLATQTDLASNLERH